ncbi:hypothetical protein PMAYCL1PPCAC_32630, partial [Pristionchus mayeri]
LFRQVVFSFRVFLIVLSLSGMADLEQLRARASQWTLADDSKLITALSSLVDSMLSRAASFDASLVATSSAISRLHASIDTAESTIGLHSGTQFIEQRVMDDDYRPRRPSEPVPTLSLEQRQAIILGDIRGAMKSGLQMIDESFRRLGDESDPFIQYEPIDPYNRPIPPLIGSEAFHAMGRRKKREGAVVRETISVSVEQQPKGERESSPSSSSPALVPSPPASTSQFIGISAFPPAAEAPAPPPPPPMPTKVSPVPATDRSALNAQIASTLLGKRGEFKVPHDDGPSDVDTGLTPPLPPRSSLHPAHPAAPPPVVPPRGSIQHATAPELPPKRGEDQPSESIPLPAEPKKKSIFDFDSDDDDFATVLSRPTKTAASSLTLSSSMRSNESDEKSVRSQHEEQRKEPSTRLQAGPSSLVSELAAAAASKRAQQLAGTSSSSAPPLPPRSEKKAEETAPPAPLPNPFAASTPAPKREEKKEVVEKAKPAAAKKLSTAWTAPKKSIFDDDDSDFDELFKTPAKKKEEPKKEEVKREEHKKIEEKKPEEAPKPALRPPEKTKRKNLFDSDSDLEDFFKPKTPSVKKTSVPKREEPPKAAERLVERPLSNREKQEERREKEEKEQAEHGSAEKTHIAAPSSVESREPAEEIEHDPITADPVVSEKETRKSEERQAEVPPVAPPCASASPAVASTETERGEAEKEKPLSPLEQTAFTPLRESPPPFEQSQVPSKSASEERESSPFVLPKATPAAAPVKKELSVHFDSPPPFVQPEEESAEEGDQRDSSAAEDSDTEAMQGNRAAFMAQLNAKLAAKPPTGMGIRPVSMIETSSTPFLPSAVYRTSAVPPPPITRRAASETKPEGPLSHANKSRPKGPARRPPTTAKRVTSSSDSDDALKSATLPLPTVHRSTVVAAPRSPVASSPVKESPVVFRKTSDPKSPPASISRKSSSSSSLGADADPLSALSATHTSPYKGASAAPAKPPTAPMSRMTISSMPSAKTEATAAAPSTQSTDTKPKKSIFDSDSDDFFEKIGGSKTLPSKSSAFRSELESALKKDKAPAASSSSQKKGIFDDSDEDLDMFRKKK